MCTSTLYLNHATLFAPSEHRQEQASMQAVSDSIPLCEIDLDV